MSEQKIGGVPEGWRLVRIGKPIDGEWVIDNLGDPSQVIDDTRFYNYCVIEKSEQPKQYRPFANAAEFEPHRDRWLNPKFAPDQYIRTTAYIDRGHWVFEEYNTWEKMFANYLFDDGSPFGVEVTE